MTNAASPDLYIGRTAVDPQGDKIGTIGQVYVNDQTGQPDWITINTGLFGMRENFVPLAGSSFNGEELVVPFDKTVVKESPDVPDASHLDADEQQQLHAYYQSYLPARGAVADGHQGNPSDRYQATGRHVDDQHGTGFDASGPTTDKTLNRSDAERPLLRKYVVTDQQSGQVPVSHEREADRPAGNDTVSHGGREEQLSRLDKLERDIAAERDRLNTPDRDTRDRLGAQRGVEDQRRPDSVREVDLASLETKVTDSQREAWSLGYQAGLSDAQSGGKTTANPFHPLREE